MQPCPTHADNNEDNMFQQQKLQRNWVLVLIVKYSCSNLLTETDMIIDPVIVYPTCVVILVASPTETDMIIVPVIVERLQ